MRILTALSWAMGLRRRSGKVKLAIIMFILAAAFGVDSAMQIGGYAALLGQRVEYTLDSSFTGGLLEAKLDQLRELPGVLGASRLREYSIASDEVVLEVSGLSRQYVTECLGLTVTGEAHQFWLGEDSFRSFAGATSQSPVRLEYTADESRDSGVFCLSPELEGSHAVAVCSSLDLEDASSVRVMLDNAEPTGEAVKRLGSMGFSLHSREQLIEGEYRTELLMTKLGYGLCAAALAAISGWTLLRAGVKEDRLERIARESFTNPPRS